MFSEISRAISYMQKSADASSRSRTTFTPAKQVANTAIYRQTGVVAKPWARSPSEPKFQQRHICTLQYVATRRLQSLQAQHTHISSHVASSTGMELYVNAVSLFKKPTTCLILIFWHMAPCSLVDRYQHFRGTYRRNISPGSYPEDGNRPRDYYASAHSTKRWGVL